MANSIQITYAYLMHPLFKVTITVLLLVFSAYGQQTSVAVLPSDGDKINNDELEALTAEMRMAALKVLPTNAFVLLKQDVVVKRLGGAENYIKECKESTCIVDLGKKAQVDYVAQASVGKLGNKMRLNVELYNVRSEGLIGMLTDEAKDVRGLIDIVKKRVSAEVFSKLLEVSGGNGKVQPPASRNYELGDSKKSEVKMSSTSGVQTAGEKSGMETIFGNLTAIVVQAPNPNVESIITSTFTDSRDGKKYKSVKIGPKTWMAENLNYEVKGFFAKSKCYENQESNCQKFGRLYNWSAAKSACPKGWHLPSMEEWSKLIHYVDSTSRMSITYAIGASQASISFSAGMYLKATNGWNGNKYTGIYGNGMDTYGFAALPGGSSVDHTGNSGKWWSATESNAPAGVYGSDMIYYLGMSYNNNEVYYALSSKSYLYSVRCIEGK